MSALDDVKLAAGYASTAIETLESAATVIGVGGEATMVLGIVDAVLKAFIGGVTAGASPADISAALATLTAGLKSNDAAADAAVTGKFGK